MSKDLGWDQIQNGRLLRLAEERGFEVLLTTDKNLCHQQNLAGRMVAIVVLGRSRWPAVKPHVQLVINAVNSAAPGSYVEVAIPAGS